MIPYGVGDMVVCIVDEWWSLPGDPSCPFCPVKGCVYTVREMIEQPPWGIYIRLVEIVNVAPTPHHREPVFLSDCFRPVKKTSIESLERLCAPTPAPVRPEFV
jgi:hypothetical protein